MYLIEKQLLLDRSVNVYGRCRYSLILIKIYKIFTPTPYDIAQLVGFFLFMQTAIIAGPVFYERKCLVDEGRSNDFPEAGLIGIFQRRITVR